MLAIDPAATSGAVVLVGGQLLAHKQVRTSPERAYMVRSALELSSSLKLPLIVCGESWGVGGKWTPSQMFGIGAQWGRWQEQLEAAGHNPVLVMRMKVNAWRKVIFGARRHNRLTWKRKAIKWCLDRYGVILTDDEAEAVCMGHAALDSAVLKKILKIKTKPKARK